MFRQRDESGNYLGNAVFTVLFLLILCAFSAKPETDSAAFSRLSFSTSLHQAALVSDDSPKFSLPESLFSSLSDFHFNLKRDRHKLILENRLFHQRFTLLQKKEQWIKLLVLQRFGYRYHAADTDDLPDLS
jgi:hypothetical protein